MVQIDIDMPEACRGCPFQDDVKGCQIIPFVPAWIQDILWHPDRRSEHCPLSEIPSSTTWNEAPKKKNTEDWVDILTLTAFAKEGGK